MVTANMDRVNSQVYRVFCVGTRHCPLLQRGRCEDYVALSAELRVLRCLTND